MKRITSIALLVALGAFFSTGCNILFPEDEGDNLALAALALLASSGASDCSASSSAVAAPVNISGTISANTTLTSSTLLTGTVYVAPGVTLTIPAGSTVFGNTGSSLFVLAGAKIVAQGTAANPICFTSAQSIGSRAPGDWGGLVLIGNAGDSASAASQTEGTTPQNYGGTTSNNDADSSGTLSYVRIEYAGFEVATGDELNCLSLYTVGNGTTLDHIQCHMGKDDSFEFFGGSVNGKYLLSTGTADDSFDMDRGYNGKLQFLIAQKYPASLGVSHTADPHGIEADGSDSGNAPTGNHGMSAPTIKNITLIGEEVTGGFGARFREGIAGSLSNGLIYGFASGNWRCDANATNTSTAVTSTLTEAAKTSNVAGACTGMTNAGLTTLPIVSKGDFSSTFPDYQPTGEAAAAASTVTGDAFFTANTTYGGMISGDIWTAGWTTVRFN